MSLPEEILFQIFDHLALDGERQLATLSLVCHQWYRMANEPQLWCHLYHRAFGQVIQCTSPKSQFQKMRLLLRTHGQRLYHLNNVDMNALHLAVLSKWESVDQIRTLLTHGMNPFQQNMQGRTALFLAAEIGNLSAVNTFLPHEKLVHISDYLQRSPLHVAASNGHHSVCVALIQAGAMPFARDANGQTPLHMAARQGHVGICRLLAPMYGRKNIEAHDSNGNTALLLAANMNQEKCMRVLMEEFYADTSATDRQGKSVMDSVQRLMSHSSCKWISDFHNFHTPFDSSHCRISCSREDETQEWNRIARSQLLHFAEAHSTFLVHYR